MYRVEALTRTVSVDDLGISVSPNLPKIISPEAFTKSLCLAELVRQGHLRVSKTSLCREELPAKQINKRKLLQTPTGPAPQPKHALLPQRSSGLSPEKISEAVATTVEQAVATTVKQVAASTFKEAIEGVVRSAIDSAVKAAVERTLSELPHQDREFPRASARSPRQEDSLPISSEAPMFIPSGIVPKEVSGEISVVSQTQSSEGLGDSASALKKLRKGASK